MGYIDNQAITVDAVLTKKGRELLAQGQNFFSITKFALADDEIDYALWNEIHPDGSNYYGYAIEQMPILEPSVNDVLVMRSKLISLPRDTVRIPVITVQPTTIILRDEAQIDITPQTVQSAASSLNLNGTLGYACILHDSSIATLTVVVAPGNEKAKGTGTAAMPITYGDDSGMSVYANGFVFRIKAKRLPLHNVVRTTYAHTKLTIIGNETGGLVEIAVTISDSDR